MIPPLDALSIASAVVAFVDFGGKLLVTGYSIYTTAEGASTENVHIEKLTTDLKALSDKLYSKPSRTTAGRSSVGIRFRDDGAIEEVENVETGNDDDLEFEDEDESALKELSRSCSQLAQELLEVLEDLKVKSAGALRTWSTVRQSIRTVCKKDKIKLMQKRLDRIRVQLNSRLLAVVVNLQNDVTDSMNAMGRSSKDMHIANIKELEGLRNDLTVALRHQEHEIKFLSEAASRSDEEHMIAIGIVQRSLNELLTQVKQVSLQDRDLARTNEILDSFKFAEMGMRHDDIREAYQKTFNWIFDSDTTPFQDWLEKGSGVFWVNGKAGSGKSTLMKYLSHHKRTQDLLHSWAGQKRLVFATFYFWDSGYNIQKTQEGLLRSLLVQILRQCPELVPLVAPERWDSGGGISHLEPWSRARLSTALRQVLGQQHLHARFCFFIDGLDEYAGEKNALIEDLAAISELRTNDVKICVSSRPWNAFRKAYGHRKHLTFTLQDLTKSDMLTYIRGMLADDPKFVRLTTKEEDSHRLLEELQDRAQGVFLWVFLVVRSLLRGLNEDDDIDDLMARLQALPTDLNDYFRHILDSIEDVYRLQTTLALQMAVNAGPLPLLVFWYLPRYIKDSEFSIKLHISPIARTDVALQIREQATTFLNKWCKDLLEVHRAWNEVQSQPFVGYNVVFLHRTVRDFLLTDEIQSLLSRYTAHRSVWYAMVSLHLARSKALPSRCDPKAFVAIAGDVMECAGEIERQGDLVPAHMLRELDLMGKHHIAISPKQHWTVKANLYRLGLVKIDSEASFVVFAMSFGLFSFATQLLTPDLSDEERSILLYDALFCVAGGTHYSFSREHFQEFIRALVRQGVNLNTPISDSSPCLLLQEHLNDGHRWLESLKPLFVQHGADFSRQATKGQGNREQDTEPGSNAGDSDALPEPTALASSSGWRWPSWVEITNRLTAPELRDDDYVETANILINPLYQ